MDETYNTIGVVIKNEPWREFDSRVSVYTPDRGKLDLVARGTKKIKSKLAGHLEPATLVNLMVIRGRRMDYVGFATGADQYPDLRENWDSAVTAGKIFNAFNNLVKPEERDEKLFGLLLEVLDIIGKKRLTIDYDFIYSVFVFKLLALLGYKPELLNCVICKSKILANNKSKIDLSWGGLVCPKCQSKAGKSSLTSSDNCIKILRIILSKNLSEILKIKIEKKLAAETVKIIGHYQEVYRNL